MITQNQLLASSDIFVTAVYVRSQYIIIVSIEPKRVSLCPKEFEVNHVKKLAAACMLLNIQLLDLLIVSEKKYFSFHESNIL